MQATNCGTSLSLRVQKWSLGRGIYLYRELLRAWAQSLCLEQAWSTVWSLICTKCPARAGKRFLPHFAFASVDKPETQCSRAVTAATGITRASAPWHCSYQVCVKHRGPASDWPPFLHKNCNGWENRGAQPRGQQPWGRWWGWLSPPRPSSLLGSSAFLGYGFSAETSRRVNLAGRPSPSCTIPLSSDWVSVIRWWEPHGRACPSFSQRWNIIKYHLHPEKHPLLKSLMPVTHALCLTCLVKWEVSGRTQSF